MPRKSGRKRAHTPPSRRRKYLGLAAIGLLAGFALYLGYLNHLINARFEGDTWALPSRVYSRALELYPGLALGREQLEYELELSSYLEVDFEPRPGQYRRLGESIEMHARDFDFGGDLQPARRVQVFFENDRVAGLSDSANGGTLRLFRLPPVIIGSYYPDNGEDRLLLAPDEVPGLLVDPLIAVEDRRFYEHTGSARGPFCAR